MYSNFCMHKSYLKLQSIAGVHRVCLIILFPSHPHDPFSFYGYTKAIPKVEAKGDWYLQNSDLVKNPDGTDI